MSRYFSYLDRAATTVLNLRISALDPAPAADFAPMATPNEKSRAMAIIEQIERPLRVGQVQITNGRLWSDKSLIVAPFPVTEFSISGPASSGSGGRELPSDPPEMATA